MGLNPGYLSTLETKHYLASELSCLNNILSGYKSSNRYFNIQRVQLGSFGKLSTFLKFLIGQRGLGKPVEKATFSSLEAKKYPSIAVSSSKHTVLTCKLNEGGEGKERLLEKHYGRF